MIRAHRLHVLIVLALLFVVLPVATVSAQGGTPPAPTPTPTVREACAERMTPECAVRIAEEWGVIILIVVLVTGGLLLSFFGGVREGTKKAGERFAGWVVSLFRRTPDATRDYLESFILEYEDPKFKSLKLLQQYQDVRLPKLEEIYLPVTVTFEPTEEERAVRAKGGEGQSAESEARTISAGMREHAEPVELTQVLQKSPRIAIVGAAGSGKSTLLQWAGLACAHRLLGHKMKNEQTAFVKALGRPLVPIFIPLGAYDRYCQTEGRAHAAAAMLDFLTVRYQKLREPRRSRRASPRLPADFFDRKLREGCLLLFDGLDEVSPDRRDAARRAIVELLREYSHSRTRALVTARTRVYAGEAQISDFRRGDVAPLDETRRNRLIRNLYAYYEPNRAVQRSDDLIRSIDASDERVRRLADTPLLTTIFTIVHRAHRRLPQQRAELYHEAIETLLAERHRGDDFMPPLDGAEDDATARRRRLAVIAFHMHLAGRGEEGMAENDLIDLVLPDFPATATEPQHKRREIRDFMHAVANRGGLLSEQDRMFSFRDHRTFQEFLAGWHLAHSYAPYSLEKQAEFLSQHLLDDHWVEPVRLAVGSLAIDNERAVNEFLNMLKSLGHTVEECDHAVALAGLSLSDLPPQRPAYQLRDELAAGMLAVFPRLTLKPLLRRELGLALGALVDPAAPGRLLDTRLKPGSLPDLITIPAGPFRMGTSDEEAERLKAQEAEAWDDEKPQHTVTLSEFAIGKYPVTNAEFRAFWEAKGYEQQQWWGDDGWRWRQGQLEPDLSIYSEDIRKDVDAWLKRRPVDKRDRPFFWDDPQWNAANLPVVGVTWYEAEAYCQWLSAVIPLGGTQAAGKGFRLPTEAEWEKTARVRIPPPSATGEGPGVGVLWPWGDEWDTNKCNSGESGFNATTPVGMYLDGASPHGVMDMVGNVWEWCGDWWEQDLYSQRVEQALDVQDPTGPASGLVRVVRGGSWNGNRRNCRSACRSWDVPADFYNLVGFRVVLSPVGS